MLDEVEGVCFCEGEQLIEVGEFYDKEKLLLLGD